MAAIESSVKVLSPSFTGVSQKFQFFFGRRERQPSLPPFADRWLSLWRDHGLPMHLVPEVLPTWSGPRSALHEPYGGLVDHLSDDVLTATCRLLDVERAWLDGTSNRQYHPLCLSERGDLSEPQSVITELLQLDEHAELVAFRPPQGRRVPHRQWAKVLRRTDGCLVLRARVKEWNGGELTLWRHVPIFSVRSYDNGAQLTLAIELIRLADRLGMWIFGCECEATTSRAIADGEAVPHAAIEGGWNRWSPEDLADEFADVLSRPFYW